MQLFYTREDNTTIWTKRIGYSTFYLFRCDIPGVTQNEKFIEDNNSPMMKDEPKPKPKIIMPKMVTKPMPRMVTKTIIIFKKNNNSYIIENMEKISRPSYQENVSAKKMYRNGKNARDKINQKKKLAEK
jgi:hypothetical protein